MFEEINRRCFFIAKTMTRSRIYKLLLAGFVITIVCASTVGIRGQSADPTSEPGAAGEPYPNMPSIAPIGVRIAKYLDVPASAQGSAIDPAKGYRVQDLGSGLYMITDNAIQSMFLVYDRGVVVIDAPQNLAVYIPKAIAELTNNPITHLIYSHSHADHIGGAKALGGHPIIIAHEETLRLLKRDGIRTGHCPPSPSLTTTHCALASKYSIFHTTAMPMSRGIFSSPRRRNECLWSSMWCSPAGCLGTD